MLLCVRIPPLLQSSSINRPSVDVCSLAKQKALRCEQLGTPVVVLTCVFTRCTVLRKKYNRKCSMGFFIFYELAVKKNPKENGFSVMSASGMRHNFMENTHFPFTTCQITQVSPRSGLCGKLSRFVFPMELFSHLLRKCHCVCFMTICIN